MPFYDRYLPIRHFPSNDRGRDFVVGDLHGCAHLLYRANELLQFNIAIDRMFSVGDLIDRGPDSVRTLELMYHEWFYPVRANHEDMMIKAVVDQNEYMLNVWLRNGGGWMRNVPETKLRELAEAASTLPLVIAVGETGTDRFNVAHAEVAFETDTARVVATDQMLDDTGTYTPDNVHALLWGRTMISSYDKRYPPGAEYLYHHPRLLSTTYVGHTPTTEVVRVQNQVYLDGGAVFAASQPHTHSRSLVIAEPNAGVIHRYVPATDTIYTDFLQDIARYS